MELFKFESLPSPKARELRKAFISHFVDTAKEHYQTHIATLKPYPDGMFYEGYLWDCLKDNTQYQKECSMEEAAHLLAKKASVLVMWDLFSSCRVLDPRRFSLEFPKDTVLQVSGPDLAKRVVAEWDANQGFHNPELWLPEDIYCFDETMSWYVIFTHEEWDHQTRPELDEDAYIRICFQGP